MPGAPRPAASCVVIVLPNQASHWIFGCSSAGWGVGRRSWNHASVGSFERRIEALCGSSREAIWLATSQRELLSATDPGNAQRTGWCVSKLPLVEKVRTFRLRSSRFVKIQCAACELGWTLSLGCGYVNLIACYWREGFSSCEF